MEEPIYCPLCSKLLISMGNSLFHSIMEDGINKRHYYYYKQHNSNIKEIIRLNCVSLTVLDLGNDNYSTIVNIPGVKPLTIDYRVSATSEEKLMLKLNMIGVFA